MNPNDSYSLSAAKLVISVSNMTSSAPYSTIRSIDFLTKSLPNPIFLHILTC